MPFKKIIAKAVEVLQSGGVLLYPTDTIWGLGCDATHEKAVAKISAIKGRAAEKGYILLLNDVEKLSEWVMAIPPTVRQYLSTKDERPVTIIYPKGKNLAPEALAPDGSIAIRITRDPFCRTLVGALNRPIVSTSANLSGQPPPQSFSDIDPAVIRQVDYTTPYRQDERLGSLPSKIIRLSEEGDIEVIRP